MEGNSLGNSCFSKGNKWFPATVAQNQSMQSKISPAWLRKQLDLQSKISPAIEACFLRPCSQADLSLSPDLIDLGLPTLRRTARRNKHRQCWSLESTFAQPVAQPKHPLGHAWTVLAASRDSLLCFHATLRTYQCRKCKKGATTFKQSPPKVCVDAGPSCCWMLWFRPLTSLKGTVGIFLGPRTAILRSRTCLPSSPAAALALLPCPRLLCARLSLAGLTCLWQMEPRHIAGGSRMPT